jgi:hypothetical protein
MMTGLLAVENILGAHYDLWEVNADQEYQEEFRDRESKDSGYSLAGLASGQPAVPERVQVRTVASAIESEA